MKGVGYMKSFSRFAVGAYYIVAAIVTVAYFCRWNKMVKSLSDDNDEEPE